MIEFQRTSLIFQLRLYSLYINQNDDLDKFILHLAGIKVCLERKVYYELKKELHKLFSEFDRYSNNPKRYSQNHFRKTNIDIFRMEYNDMEEVARRILRNLHK